MTLYLDRLCAASVLKLVRLRGIRAVQTLDALPDGVRLRLYRGVLGGRGITVGRLPFFLGDLRADDGESLYRYVRRLASSSALEEAERTVSRDVLLSELDRRYRPGTIALHVAKRLYAEIEPRLRHVAIARAIGGPGARLLLSRPERFSADLLRSAGIDVRIEWYRDWRAAILLPALVLRACWQGCALAVRRLAPGTVPAPSADDAPALLVPQQDDLGLDRSLRQQPHWLFPGRRPRFRTLVWMNGTAAPPADVASLAAAGIEPVPAAMAAAIAAKQGRTRLSRQLMADRWRTLRRSMHVDRVAAYALLNVGQLLRRAYVGSGLCSYFRVGAFLTGENYFVESDALPLIGDAAGVRTAAYQYSNISHCSVPMLTTADVMLTFSPMYEKVWRSGRIGPRAIVPIGYPYRPALPYVRDRARRRRERLAQVGATFVLAYFDESVQSDAYGQVHRDRHREELCRLFRIVADNPDFGLIVKTQFEANAPSRVCAGADELAAAQASGRYDEMLTGARRNAFLPAEAALAADMAIGSAIGATAALESALAGTRTLVLNPFGWRGAWDHLYDRCAIVQPSLDAALEAIQRFRAGTGEPALGDWSPILRHFDPFADADPSRWINLLEALVAGETRMTATAAAG